MLATLKAGLDLLLGLLGFGRQVAQQVQDGHERAAGQAEQKAADQAPVIAAAARIQEAEAKPHDDQTTSDRLRDGIY